MSTHNIPFAIYKRNHPLLSHIYSCLQGLKIKFETAEVNAPLEFQPLKFYCTVELGKYIYPN